MHQKTRRLPCFFDAMRHKLIIVFYYYKFFIIKFFDIQKTALFRVPFSIFNEDYSSSFLSFKETFLKKFFNVVPRD